jgi:IS30 family transposase
MISVPTIYHFVYSVYGIWLTKYLCTKRDRRKKRHPKPKRTIIPNRVWIDDRPESVDFRKKIGDWEADYIVSQKGDSTAFLTLLERKSRYLQGSKLFGKIAKTTQKMINQHLHRKPAHTLTMDTDIGFSRHEKMNIPTFFTHPYSSWEKGQVEYAMRLLRRLIPKKSSLENLSQKALQHFLFLLNNTPRKCLNWKTPHQVFYNLPS